MESILELEYKNRIQVAISPSYFWLYLLDEQEKDNVYRIDMQGNIKPYNIPVRQLYLVDRATDTSIALSDIEYPHKVLNIYEFKDSEIIEHSYNQESHLITSDGEFFYFNYYHYIYMIDVDNKIIKWGEVEVSAYDITELQVNRKFIVIGDYREGIFVYYKHSMNLKVAFRGEYDMLTLNSQNIILARSNYLHYYSLFDLNNNKKITLYDFIIKDNGRSIELSLMNTNCVLLTGEELIVLTRDAVYKGTYNNLRPWLNIRGIITVNYYNDYLLVRNDELGRQSYTLRQIN